MTESVVGAKCASTAGVLASGTSTDVDEKPTADGRSTYILCPWKKRQRGRLFHCHRGTF